MQTKEGKKIERLLGQLSNSPTYTPVVEAFDRLTELLDEIYDSDSEGWRKKIGWED